MSPAPLLLLPFVLLACTAPVDDGHAADNLGAGPSTGSNTVSGYIFGPNWTTVGPVAATFNDGNGPDKQVTTDDAGAYSFAGGAGCTAPQCANVEVYFGLLPGYSMAVDVQGKFVENDQGRLRHDFYLVSNDDGFPTLYESRPLPDFTLTVQLADGTRILGADVQLKAQDNLEVTTDGNGRAYLHNIYPGTQQFVVSTEDQSQTVTELVSGPSCTLTVSF
jgi:hypothetical protein